MPLALSPRLDPVQDDTREPHAPVPRARADAPVNDNTPAPANDNAAPAGVQKRARGTSRISAQADRQFLREFKALTDPGVYVGSAPSTVPTIVSVFKGYGLSDPLPVMTKTPRHWRDATDEIQAHFALEALRERGPAVTFTVWCSDEISDRAYATGAPLPWLRKRLKKALDDALGPVEWMASLEEERRDGKLRLHIHGTGAFGDLTRSRRKGIRKAMRRALGAWEGPAAQYQVKLKIMRDAGWASYVTKRCWLARPGIRALFACAGPRSPWCLSFDGPVLTMTNGARARAQELHREARRIVLEARDAAKKPASAGTAPAPPPAACESRGASFEAVVARTRTTSSRSHASVSTPETPASFTPTTTSRSRDPPGPGSGASAGPDPPLPESLLKGQVAEHELPALAVAEGYDSGAGHEAGLPRHDGLAAQSGAALDRDDDRRVRVSHRPSAGAADRAREGDPKLSDARVVAGGLPCRGRAVRQLPGDRDAEQRRRLRDCHTGQENGQDGQGKLLHARRRSGHGRACHQSGVNSLWATVR